MGSQSARVCGSRAVIEERRLYVVIDIAANAITGLAVAVPRPGGVGEPQHFNAIFLSR